MDENDTIVANAKALLAGKPTIEERLTVIEAQLQQLLGMMSCLLSIDESLVQQQPVFINMEKGYK
jgi:hypothetical protein